MTDRPTHLNVSIDLTVPMRASIPIDPDADLETAVFDAYSSAMLLADELAAELAEPYGYPDLACLPARTAISLFSADIARPEWLSDKRLGLGETLHRSDITTTPVPNAPALQAHGYLPWDDCPTAEGNTCGLQTDHDWKEGSTHTCSEIPGHRMDHHCTCGHQWRQARR